MINREVFARDPLKTTILNNGVARLDQPKDEQEWEVLRQELSNFVCEGEYEQGLYRILFSYLKNIDGAVQPAIWVSGFFGSGKSHLVRVLASLWSDVTFPDNARARGLVTLPNDIDEKLRELSTAGKRAGGLWAAAGTLGTGTGDSVRLEILGIVLRSAGLPEQYAQGRFVLWLKQNGLYEGVKAGVESAGASFQDELAHLFFSRYIPASLLRAYPTFAANEAEVRALVREEYPVRHDVSDEEMVQTMAEVLALQSGDRDRLPCTLLVLDELQQYVADDADRMLDVQNAVETCTRRFGSRLLFVATGQSALQAVPLLRKLQDRFTVRVELSDTDVEQVVRQVVLRKDQAKGTELRKMLEEVRGEIDRQLSGTNIAPTRADDGALIPDYPLLPSRRRFWERVLRATDRAGSSSQVRAQLRIVHDATRDIAIKPVGTVIPADVLYEHIAPDLLGTRVLLREVDETIRKQRDGTEDGELRFRLCALIFLIGQLPTDPGADTGIRATAETLADLMVEDLRAGSTSLRSRIPQLLEGLVETGELMQVDGEYRLQTRESAEWTADFQSAYANILGDDGRIADDRTHELWRAAGDALRGIRFTHGESKTPRNVEPHYGSDAPAADAGAVPVWVRDEWSVGEASVKAEARAAGPEDPIVHVFLPRRGADDIKKAIATYAAATEVLNRRAATTQAGQEARDAMESRQRAARSSLDSAIRSVLEDALVLQGGGARVTEHSLRAAVEKAARDSLDRLYPQFGVGDHARWDAVVRRARDGSNDPLGALGYEGDADQHPACSRVLAFVGPSGKKGSEVRRHFRSPPCGWPQDAVDGSLLALLSQRALLAMTNGTPVTAKEVDQGKIGITEFRSETVPFGILQLITVRKLFSDAELQVRSGEELVGARQYLDRMLDLARSAGGEPPLPQQPDTTYVREIRQLGGNELLVALYEQRDRLRGDDSAWKAAEREIGERSPRWERLGRLLEHGRSLSETERLREQADAIYAGRTLLDDPDPVPGLLNEIADLLRNALGNVFSRYSETFESEMRALEDSDAWQSLSEEEREDILRTRGLVRRSEPRVANPEAVLDSLDATSLSEWENLTAALPELFAQAKEAAVKKREPSVHRFQPPSATLRTEPEVDEYLEKVKAEIMRYVKAGRPVML